MARKTSIEVYRRIIEDGILGKRQRQVFDYIDEHDGPVTIRQAITDLVGTNNATYSSISPRFSELEAKGAIKTVGEKSCEVTGNTVYLWDVTNKVPKKTDKAFIPPTRNELIHALCKQIEEMDAHLSARTNVPEKWREWQFRTMAIVAQCSKHRKRATPVKSLDTQPLQ